jgi:hypothetical protein
VYHIQEVFDDPLEDKYFLGQTDIIHTLRVIRTKSGSHTAGQKKRCGLAGLDRFHTGIVEGYVCFPDGPGVAHVPVIISSEGGGSLEELVYTDESGYYRKEGLPYWGPNQHEGVYKVAPSISGFKDTRPLQFGSEPGENVRNNVSFTVTVTLPVLVLVVTAQFLYVLVLSASVTVTV